MKSKRIVVAWRARVKWTAPATGAGSAPTTLPRATRAHADEALVAPPHTVGRISARIPMHFGGYYKEPCPVCVGTGRRCSVGWTRERTRRGYAGIPAPCRPRRSRPTARPRPHDRRGRRRNARSLGRWRRQMVGRTVAIGLIVVGGVLVLNNLGLTRLSIREIAGTWWPVLLIVGGLSLLFRGRGR